MFWKTFYISSNSNILNISVLKIILENFLIFTMSNSLLFLFPYSLTSLFANIYAWHLQKSFIWFQ